MTINALMNRTSILNILSCVNLCDVIFAQHSRTVITFLSILQKFNSQVMNERFSEALYITLYPSFNR